MTTNRRRPAAAGRILAGGISAATALALIAGWSMSADTVTPIDPAPDQPLRVVITDPAIDPEAAIAAALDAHARGLDRTQVAVAQATSAPGLRAQTNASHSTTQAS